MTWLWWIVGTLGVGGALALGAGLIFGWPVLLAFFTQTKIGRALAFVGGLILTGLLIFARGRAAGKADEQERQKVQTEKEVERAEQRSKAIDAKSDDEVDQELSKWDRKQ